MDAETKILSEIKDMKKDISTMKKEIDMILEYIEDSNLTEEEKKLVDESLEKIKKGDKSDFISHEDLKKDLGL